MFNMYGQGAYLIWQWAPREKVFIDGLNAYPFSWYEHYARIAGGDEDLARVISQWGIRYFLLDRDQFSRAGPQRLIAQLEGLGWRLVYYDGRDFIYVPDAPENRDLIARYAYHYLRPVAVGVESDLDHPAELRAELQRMIASNPQSPHGHDSAARILLALEDPLAAANEWEAMVRLSRNPAQAYLRLGRACAALGLTDRELDSYRRAARLSPRNADIRRALADFYQNAGQFRESVAERKRVIRLQRRDPSGHFELARTYAIQAQAAGAPKEQLLRRARAELTTASRLGPSAMIAHALGSVHLELGNAPAAMRAFEQGIALDPTWFPNYLGLAQAQEAARDRAGAIDAWRRALAHAPDADAARLAQERLRALQPPAPGVDAIPD
jgi:tetratricopeptide (TPR) repeat protein